jgi:long-chain acyl-CoA synthetase
LNAPPPWLDTPVAGEPAIVDGLVRLDYPAVGTAVAELAGVLRRAGVHVLATRCDNAVAWAVIDLAAWTAGIVHVPVPSFFTRAQLAHVLTRSGADALLGSRGAEPDTALYGLPGARIEPPIWSAGIRLEFLRFDAAARPQRPRLPEGTVKLSFTSGSTGTPKGACLSGDGLRATAEGIAQALAPLGISRHLCALPLPVLLENVAGLYAPLAAGATVVIPPLAEVGLTGSSRFDPALLQRAVERFSADSVIVLPQMLRAWAAWRTASGRSDAPAPRFIAVGGAAVGAATLAAARAAGLPAYEGYGLTEAGSVQTLNLPGADRPGSAGRPLPHARVRVSDEGEVEVAGALMRGYLGDPPAPQPTWWATGDLGRIDDAGYLHLSGRRRNVLITSFGRNLSPEWVETALQSQPAIAWAAVFGEGRPAPCAVLWPSLADLPDAVLDAAVRAACAELPDYARPGHWVRATAPFDAAHGMATINGRPCRDAIEHQHRAALAAGYMEQGKHAIS